MSVIVTDAWVHPTAVIGSDVRLASDVTVGPYAILEGPMQIGPGTVIEAHACLYGPLTMGRDNYVGHGAVLGKAPQHRGYRGETTSVEIGDRNAFREYVTVHRGTIEGGGVTRIGSGNMLMVGSHLGHDVQLGDNCTLVNNALVGGHARLENGCVLSGHSAVQQRVRVGRLAMLSGLAATSKDVPPFVLQQGYNCVSGLNLIGMRRGGLSSPSIDAMRSVFRIVYRDRLSLANALTMAETEFGEVPEVMEFVQFIRESPIGINPARELHPQRRVQVRTRSNHASSANPSPEPVRVEAEWETAAS